LLAKPVRSMSGGRGGGRFLTARSFFWGWPPRDAANLNVHFRRNAQPVLWSRSRKEPKLLVGAGADIYSSPAPGHTHFSILNHNSY
jgi:hypothetical protein